MKNWFAGFTLLALTLAVPAAVAAHEGHAHKVMGTVANVDGKSLTISTTEGKTVTVLLDAKTRITRGRNKVEATAMKIGDRVVAEGPEQKGTMTAATLKLGVAAPAGTKK